MKTLCTIYKFNPTVLPISGEYRYPQALLFIWDWVKVGPVEVCVPVFSTVRVRRTMNISELGELVFRCCFFGLPFGSWKVCLEIARNAQKQIIVRASLAVNL